ncbi:MAG: GlcNAc-PI de-N-acetylase [Anaerolineales bacterium]|nr:GlcNAc-PI de-N-acetylase [Anaerolineales bacterium]
MRLLAVLAHPDDESFGLGGTLALYAQHNVETHLICATRGEVGEVDPDLLQGYENIAKLREDELLCAASILGIKDIHYLDYRDSGMPGSPENQHPDALASARLDDVAARITSLIRQIRPQVVVTFDPYGGYGHPDHIAVQRACTEAFHAAGSSDLYPDGLTPHAPQKLYYHTFPRRMMRLLVRLMPLFGQNPREFGQNRDIDLVAIASHAFPIHVSVDIRKVADIKERASACHSSQSAPSGGGILRLLFRRFAEFENYMRAYPPAPNKLKEHNLFEGVTSSAGG